MRKFTVVVLSLLILAPAFVAAGPPTPEGGDGDVAEITIYEGQPLRIQQVQAIIPRMEAELPVKITIVEGPNVGTDYLSKMITALQGGEGFDLMRTGGEVTVQ